MRNHITYEDIRLPDEARSCSWILSLAPDASTSDALTETFDAYARACAYVCRVGRRVGTTGNARLHDLCYQDVRGRFALTANLAIRAIARSAGLLKRGKCAMAMTRNRIDYDPRVLSIAPGDKVVSIATVRGRCRAVRARACDGRWPPGGVFSRAALLRRDSSLVLLVWGDAGTPSAFIPNGDVW